MGHQPKVLFAFFGVAFYYSMESCSILLVFYFTLNIY